MMDMTILPERALSIRQPWANAIIHHGKDVENRNWRTKFRGPVLIHAAKAWGPSERDDLGYVEHIIDNNIDRDARPALGGIVGIAEIVDCVERSNSPWFFGRYGFVLANARPLDFIPVKGALGFFRWRDRRTPPAPEGRNTGADHE